MFSNQKLKILYVDDDPDDLFLVTSLLKRINDVHYEIDGATSIEEAIPKLDQSL